MQLILNKEEFIRIPEKSTYNNNYYRHIKLGYVIYEICYEDFDYQEFYSIESDDNRMFLGCSHDAFGFRHGDTIKIDFKFEYT